MAARGGEDPAARMAADGEATRACAALAPSAAETFDAIRGEMLLKAAARPTSVWDRMQGGGA